MMRRVAAVIIWLLACELDERAGEAQRWSCARDRGAGLKMLIDAPSITVPRAPGNDEMHFTISHVTSTDYVAEDDQGLPRRLHLDRVSGA